MIKLSNKTIQIINNLFHQDLRNEVCDLLKIECSDNIPYYKDSDKLELERIRFSVLKLSMGRMDKLIDAIELAQTDCRDLFVAAEFENDPKAHEVWAQIFSSN